MVGSGNQPAAATTAAAITTPTVPVTMRAPTSTAPRAPRGAAGSTNSSSSATSTRSVIVFLIEGGGGLGEWVSRALPATPPTRRDTEQQRHQEDQSLPEQDADSEGRIGVARVVHGVRGCRGGAPERPAVGRPHRHQQVIAVERLRDALVHGVVALRLGKEHEADAELAQVRGGVVAAAGGEVSRERRE